MSSGVNDRLCCLMLGCIWRHGSARKREAATRKPRPGACGRTFVGKTGTARQDWVRKVTFGSPFTLLTCFRVQQADRDSSSVRGPAEESPEHLWVEFNEARGVSATAAEVGARQHIEGGRLGGERDPELSLAIFSDKLSAGGTTFPSRGIRAAEVSGRRHVRHLCRLNRVPRRAPVR
jgi:hypothetical protein